MKFSRSLFLAILFAVSSFSQNTMDWGKRTKIFGLRAYKPDSYADADSGLAIIRVTNLSNVEIYTYDITGNLRFKVDSLGSILVNGKKGTQNLALFSNENSGAIGDSAAAINKLGDVLTDKIQANTAAGLSLFEDGGAGLFVKDGGKVGVNFLNPAYALHIFSATGPQFGITHTVGQDSFSVSVDGNALTTFTTVDGGGAAGHFNFVPDGNFGIANATPGTKLDVTGAITSSTGLRIKTNDGGAIGASGTAYSDLFLASGGVINFNAGNSTITDGTNLTIVATGDISIDPTGGDVDLNGSYALDLQNISDGRADGASYWFDGVNDKIVISDDDALSFGDGTNDTQLSIMSRIVMNDATNFIVACKREGAANQEYIFRIDISDKLSLLCQDDSESATISTTSDVGITVCENKELFVAATYDGSGSGSGMVLYVNGKVIASTAGSSGAYTAMENEGASLYFGHNGNVTYANGKFVENRLFNKTLTTTEIKAFYSGSETEYKYTGDGLSDNPGDAYISGTLVIGRQYIITSYLGSDVFTNVGAGSNATGVEFVATGTTPTTWTSSTVLTRQGEVGKWRAKDFTPLVAYDASGNGNDGVVNGPILINAHDTGYFTDAVTIGSAIDQLTPTFSITADYDSDGGVASTGVFTIGNTAAVDPTDATTDFTMDNGKGFTFNKDVAITGGLDVVLAGDEAIVIDGSTDDRDINLGTLRIEQKPNATNNDTRALTVNIDNNNAQDTHAMVVNFIATGLAAGETGSAYDVNIISDGATGGVMRGFEVSMSGTGTGVVAHALHVDPEVDVIGQESGSFGALDVGFSWTPSAYTDRTAAFNATGTDVQLFVADDDTVFVAMLTTFAELEVSLNTPASNPGIKPKFYYITDAGAWVLFTPSDETQGFRQGGVISWLVADLTTWGQRTINEVTGEAGAVDHYWIAIVRTQVSLSTPPTEDLIQTVSTTIYGWDKDGVVSISKLEVAGNVSVATVTITTSSDAVAIGGGSILNVDTNSGHVTIGGFTGGVAGQILHIYNSDTNNVLIEDDEATGNQDIKTNTGADVTITAEGGVTLIYDGTDNIWRMIGAAL